MSSLSQFIGSQTLIGESVEIYGGVPYFTEGAKEFLKTGTLKAYSAAYAAYVARCPYASYIDITPNNTVTTSSSSVCGGIFWDGTRYVLLTFAGFQTSRAVSYRYSTNLSSWTTSELAPDNTYIYDIEHQNGISVIAWSDSVGRLYVKQAGNTIFSPVVGGGDAGYVVGNPAGNLWTSINYGGSTNGSNNILTSVNGVSWTLRTGSGGTSMQVGGIFWCPCASAFYFMGTLGNNLYLNKSTDGYTQTVSIANDTTFAPLSNGWHKNIVASSPTVTLILGTNGTLKRTTDGTTWTTIDLKTQNVPDMQNASKIYYNSVTNKFYLTLSEGNGTGILLMASSSDGLTWNQMYAFRDAGTTGTYSKYAITGMSVANGKTFFRHYGSSYTSQGIFDATNDIAQATPDWVGNAAAIANKFVRIA